MLLYHNSKLLKVCKVFGVWVSFKADVVQLVDVGSIEYGESSFEFFRELFHILLVAKRQDDSRDLVILACCQLFTDSSNADYFP